MRPLALGLVVWLAAAGCARGFQPKAVDRLRTGMVVGEVAEALGPPSYITSALQPDGGAVETWQYDVKGKVPGSYCMEFRNGRLLAWRRSAVPAGQGCQDAAPQPEGADVAP